MLSYNAATDVITQLKQKVENKCVDLETKEVQFTSVGLAVVADMKKCVPSLVEGGADVNRHPEIASPLVCAADRGQTQLVNYLIRAGADVNYSDHNGITALHAAARNGHTDCVKRLVKSGVDVNKMDKEGNTSLMVAAMNGYYNCIEHLMKKGADKDFADDMGNTALMWASMADQWKCVSALLEAGADVNKANNQGDVSLMCAARKGDDQWLTKLMEAGADVNVINKLGETALTIARNNKYKNCIRILGQKGGDVNIPDLCSNAVHENREDNKRNITDILQFKEEGATAESAKMSLEQTYTLSNETNNEDHRAMSKNSGVPMIEEENPVIVTVECGVHMTGTRPKV